MSAKLILALVATLGLASSATGAGGLTATELAWLEAAVPVLDYAGEQGMPLDIVVQPQDSPGETPLGMAFINGRCKLVLSMRGNPEAQAVLDRVDPGLRSVVVEALVAHELGHCWRHLHHLWGTLPANVEVSSDFSRVSPEMAEMIRDMWQTRREEGFADLVGLAWTLLHNPARYPEVHAWFVRLRAVQEVETAAHDTRVWVRLAVDKGAFATQLSIFERVNALWVTGLVAGL